MVNATKNSVLASVTEQSGALLKAAEKKLLLLGMGKDEIEQLAKQGAAQENLYLPGGQNSIWVYISIYEYEIGLVKVGAPIEAESVAYPGEIFKGKVVEPSLTTVSQPLEQMGAEMVRTVLGLIEGKLEEPVRKKFSPELVIRRSC